MLLVRALGIGRKEVVSFVGGGGKTTAMFRLAAELSDAGRRVVTTTTTRIFAAQIRLAPFAIYTDLARGDPERAVPDFDATIDHVRAALVDHLHVLVVGTTNAEGKAFGVPPGLVDRIHALDEVDVVINEADGSRMRPFKAPGEHEPVLPDSTTLLVPVVGIDAVGAPLDDEHVHRAERVAQLAGVPPGTIIDASLIAAVVAHPEGGLKNRPGRARTIALVNKVQNVAQLLTARDIASQLLASAAIEAVAIGAVQNQSMPIAELHRRAAAIILAAGGASRMQGPLKQLLPWGDSTLVRHTALVVGQSGVSEVIVVVGRDGERVREALRGLNLRSVENPDWEQGRATSVRAGIEAVSAAARAAIFVNTDQPFLTAAVIDSILQRHFQTLAPIVVPVYAGQPGSPVLFARELFEDLKQLHGEEGGKRIIEQRPELVERVSVMDARAAFDVDTLDDYERALAQREVGPAEAVSPTVRGEG